MDELFGNLIYLIPIALVIFRVLSAITSGAKKNRQQQSAPQRQAAPPPEPARPAPPKPRPVSRDTALPHWEREKARSAAAPAPKAKKSPPPRLVPVMPAALGELPQDNAPAAPLPSAGSLTAAAGTTHDASGMENLYKRFFLNMPPLKQGFVWAEILGTPKAF